MSSQPADASREPRTARVVVEVLAGLLPGKDPDPLFTRRYVIHSDEWADAMAKADRDGGAAINRLLAETNGQAQGYAGMLMMQPDRLNWVRVDWIYL